MYVIYYDMNNLDLRTINVPRRLLENMSANKYFKISLFLLKMPPKKCIEYDLNIHVQRAIGLA